MRRQQAAHIPHYIKLDGGFFHMRSQIALVLASTTALVGMAAPATAQTAQAEPAQATSDTETGNVIIVTARRREENLQEVPLSITAFSSDDLERRSLTELEDVALLTPGFTFEDYGGAFGVPVVRGATQQDITTLEQNVSVFLDGIYVPRSYAFDLGLVDVDRIEIVKGPQSALYGQNAFMGAVNYVSSQPDPSGPSARFRASLGTDDWQELNGSINLPIVQDKLAVRLSGAISEFDGTWRNNHPLADSDVPNGTSGNAGGWDNLMFGAQVLLRPVEELTITAAYRRFELEGESNTSVRINPANGGFLDLTPNCGALVNGVPTLWCGELPAVSEDNNLIDPRKGGLISDTEIYSFGLDYELSDAFTASYSYGRIKGDALQVSTLTENALLDPDGQVGFQFIPLGNFKYWQHEARLEYDDGGPFRAMGGGFISRVDDRDAFPLYFPAFQPFFGGGPIPTLSTEPVTVEDTHFLVYDTSNVVKSKSIFGLVSYGFLDDTLRLTLEGRYTDESKEIINNQSGSTERVDDSFFAPRITLDYNVSDETLLYALAAKGTKSGGINADPGAFAPVGLIPSEKTFDADTNWTYEVGVKNTFLDGRLLMNAALFYVDWSNVQISSAATVPDGINLVANPPTIILNTGDVSIKGFEFSTVFNPIDPLTLNFNASYQDAKFKDGTISQRLRFRGYCDGVVCPLDYSIGGNTLQRSVPTNISGGFNWQDGLGSSSDLEYFVQADVAYQSKNYVDEFNLAEIPSRTLVNASVGLEWDNWGLRLWAKNLFNKEYVSSAFFITIGAEYVPIMGRKRVLGLTLSGDF